MGSAVWVPAIAGLLVVSFACWYFFSLRAKKKRNYRDDENDIYESGFFDRDVQDPKSKADPLVIEPTRPRVDPFIEGLEFKNRQDEEKSIPLFPEESQNDSPIETLPPGFDDGNFQAFAEQDSASDNTPPLDDDDQLLHKLKNDFSDLEKELQTIKESEIRKEPDQPSVKNSPDASGSSNAPVEENIPSQLDDEIIADFEAILAGNQIEPVVPESPEEPPTISTPPISEIKDQENSAELERKIDQHDEAISKLKQEMEQTIEEISSQLGEGLEEEGDVPDAETPPTQPPQVEPPQDWVQEPITNLGEDLSKFVPEEDGEKKSDQLIGQLNQFQKNLEDRFALIDAGSANRKNVVPDWLQKSPSRSLRNAGVKGDSGLSWNRPDVLELLESFIFTSGQRKKTPTRKNGIT